jgi:hypothetical protein
MAQAITKYTANDGKEFDTLTEAEAHDVELNLGKLAEQYIETLGVQKGKKILKTRILGWESYKNADADNVVDLDEAREA